MAAEQPHWRKKLEHAATRCIPGDPIHRWALLALLALAAVLRLWNLSQIPFTHDEISALLRTRFSSFSELIAKGVAIDAHPAGVQVFEWIWTGLFGTSEWVVKLPFIVLGIAALFHLYRFGAAWTSPAAALFSIAFIGTVQYTVMYAQIARPYAAGFFTCALLMDQITRALGGRKWAWGGVALAAALCAYVHHFSLMFALLAGLCLLWLAAPAQRKRVMLAGGVALVLYLPELPITWRQLGYGGVGQWLAPPTPAWLPNYVAWILEFSIPLAVVLLSVALAGWARSFRAKSDGFSPFILLCLVLGLVPLAVGYGYSVWHEPVLQYSVVIFSFPFLVFPLFAGWRNPRPVVVLTLVALIAATAVLGLVEQRKHYDIFYRSRYEVITQGIIEAGQTPGRMALYDGPGEVIEFYLHRWGIPPEEAPFINIHGRSAAWLDSLLTQAGPTSLFLGVTPAADPERIAQAQTAFPFLIERHDMEEGQSFVFNNTPAEGALNDHRWSDEAAPQAVPAKNWQVDEELAIGQDTSRGQATSTWDLTDREFGILFESPVYQLAQGDNDLIEARMDVLEAAGSGLKLVAELKAGEETVHYRSQPYANNRGGGTVVTAIPLADMPGNGRNMRLRVYVWNEGGRSARIRSVQVQVRKGDPWLYGLFQPLKEQLEYR